MRNAMESASVVSGAPLALTISKMASTNDNAKFNLRTPSVCSVYINKEQTVYNQRLTC